MTHTHRASSGRRFRRQGAALIGAAVIAAAVACNDSNVPFLTAPTQVPNSTTGVQQAIIGLIASSRNDMFQTALELSAMSRELTNFTSTEPRFIEYDTGIETTPVGSWIEMWANEYQDIRTAQNILVALPTVQPAYTSQQLAGLRGMVETLEAFNYLLVAWAHDTEGFVIMQSPNATSLNPLVCLKDGLTATVALLDSANANLNTAGNTPFPFKLPPGFGAVGQFAGPSTSAGSFAAWNRALAAKARLELAYAMGTKQPSFTQMGSPNLAMLNSADSAMKASALFQPAALPPNPSGGWSYDNFSVLFDFSSSSGDQANPMNTIIGTQAVLSQVPADQDTVNDLRWKAKFALNPAYCPTCSWPVQQAGYSQASAPGSPTVASVYIVGMYPAPGSPLPVTRSEDMTLTEAQIRLGLGDLPGAMTYVNDVRTEVGGLKALTIASDTAIRNQIMKEQEISTIMEGGADRLVSIQMYNVAAQVDTTWEHVKGFGTDVHTSMFVITSEEQSGRGGTWNPTCSK